MKKQLQAIRKILVPSDLIPAVVIIFGLLIAITINEEAIRLIGGSITILGVVALFMLISQRLKNTVELRNQPGGPIPEFEISETMDSGAKRIRFENFESEFDLEDPISQQTINDGIGREDIDSINSNIKILKPREKNYISDNGKQEIEETKLSINEIIKISEENKPDFEIKAGTLPKEKVFDLGEEDTDSSIRIIGPLPAKAQESHEPKLSSSEIVNFEYTEESKLTNEELLFDTKEEIISVVDKKSTDGQDIAKFDNKSKSIQRDEEELSDFSDEEEDYIKEVPAVKPTIRPTLSSSKVPAEDKVKVPPKDEKIFPYKEKKINVPISALIESEQFLGKEPRRELQYFLSRVLVIIRSVTNTRTAAFLFVNLEKQELILEAYVSEVPNAIKSNPKIPLGNDVVSQIIKNVKPEILTDIEPSAELDLIPYYTQQVGISSFIGVPVFYSGSVIGILCADTAIQDAYDAVTVTFFGHFSKIIGSLVQSYTEKYDLIQASKTLDVINEFRGVIDSSIADEATIFKTIVESVGSLCDWNSIGLVAFDEESDQWMVKFYRFKEKVIPLLGKTINLKNTVIGNTIISAKSALLAPVSPDIVLLYPGENPPSGGFFAAFPLKSLAHNYGALFIEGSSPTGINSNDVKIMETLCQHAGTAIEQLYFNKVIQSTAMIDSTTGLLNPTAFVQRVEEEILRSVDFNTNLHLCLFQIDKYASFDPKLYSERLQRVIEHVLKIAKKSIRPYDVFGRVDNTTFGIAFFGESLDNARLWAERLRSEVAISILEINKQRFTVTVSLGLAESSKKNKNVYNLLDSTRKVLDVSVKKANTLTVYS